MPPEKKQEKPPEKKESPSGRDPFAEIVGAIIVLFFLAYVVNGLVASFFNGGVLSHGWKGLTPQGIILSHTRPINSLNNPIDSKVVNTKDGAVYDSPGGKQIGTQKMGAKGKILQGPVEIGGERYWYVDYENGPDGWVKEGDIAYIESNPSALERILAWGFSVVSFLKALSIILSIIFIIWMGYLIRELTKLRMAEKALLYPEIVNGSANEINPKWQRVLNHIESQNENDWRLAIIEADIMLDDLLDKLSLPGETIGDKLKAVEKSDFVTIDNAWEAHKIRNQIAHEGTEYILNQREARRVIELYRTVFEEFQII